jgi:hypothetical protein
VRDLGHDEPTVATGAVEVIHATRRSSRARRAVTGRWGDGGEAHPPRGRLGCRGRRTHRPRRCRRRWRAISARVDRDLVGLDQEAGRSDPCRPPQTNSLLSSLCSPKKNGIHVFYLDDTRPLREEDRDETRIPPPGHAGRGGRLRHGAPRCFSAAPRRARRQDHKQRGPASRRRRTMAASHDGRLVRRAETARL